VHEDERLLEENRAAQAGRQDEMAFQERPGGAELIKDFGLGHTTHVARATGLVDWRGLPFVKANGLPA
jgi:hypothetical protein